MVTHPSAARRVLLVPGYGLRPESWEPLLAEVGRFPGCEVVAYRYEMDVDPVGQLARRLAEDLSAPGPTLVIAFSLGTAVLGSALASGAPNSLAGVVALGGVPGPEHVTPAYEAIASALAHSHARDDDLVALYASTPGGRRHVAEGLVQFPLSLRRRLAAPRAATVAATSLTVPWLFVFGRQDRILVPPAQEVLRRDWPGATARTVDGGHAVHLDSPLETASLVRTWLE